ncbi:class I SAM-dependent methyltransferase [Egbenema bharatensis]|uniref:class I SAM-dependent methyltransferase n=1 Tax=Egbenema bharatensis TaxID=3463334 RepID=UPI003A8BAF91
MSFDFSTASDSIANPLSYFSDRGEDYQKYRLIYPASAIDTILSDLGSPTQITAVDIGAGTGIGARLLADRGVRVVAIEPNEDMRRAATPHEGVEFLTGTAEQTPLKNASVDLVTSFQAFHWFDFDKSLQEFRRILRASGHLALIWSFWDQSDLVSKEYTRLVFEASKDREHKSQSGMQLKTWFKSIRYQLFWQGLWLPYFTNLQRHEFVSSQCLDLPGLVGLARSQGFTPSEGKGLEKLISDLAVFQQRFYDRQGSVRLIYRTHLYTAISNHT